MAATHSFKRLILRAVLRQVSPMVVRLNSVPEHLELPEFHEVVRAILGWNGDLGYIIRIHGKEFNSFRRKTRSKALHDFKLHWQEKFLYICDTHHMWEWDIRLLDIQEGVKHDHAIVCLRGRDGAPPEFCGGPTGFCGGPAGYRLMLKRQSVMPHYAIRVYGRPEFKSWRKHAHRNRQGLGISCEPCSRKA